MASRVTLEDSGSLSRETPGERRHFLSTAVGRYGTGLSGLPVDKTTRSGEIVVFLPRKGLESSVFNENGAEVVPLRSSPRKGLGGFFGSEGGREVRPRYEIQKGSNLVHDTLTGVYRKMPRGSFLFEGVVYSAKEGLDAYFNAQDRMLATMEKKPSLVSGLNPAYY